MLLLSLMHLFQQMPKPYHYQQQFLQLLDSLSPDQRFIQMPKPYHTPKMNGYSQPPVDSRSCYQFTLGGDSQGQRPPMEGDRALRQRYQLATEGGGAGGGNGAKMKKKGYSGY